MIVANAVEKMIDFYSGSRHDIAHFIKVHNYARTIGRLENLDERTLLILELAAIVHDIACPLCREKYGAAKGSLQEKEGPPLAEALLRELDCDEAIIARVCHLVGRHHTYTGVDSMDHRILLEADFLVNADEGNHSMESIRRMRENVFRTAAGTRLLDSIYLRSEGDAR